MNREIKFRGKRFGGNDFVFGYYAVFEDVTYIIPFDALHESEYMDDFVRVDPLTVGQYTGLKDKNGVEIYEGDIVQAVYKESEGGGWYSEHNIKGKIYFDTHWGVKYDCKDGTQRMAEYWGKLPHTDFSKVEIIGNIYEHEHILKE